jgi:hypothetical protein
MQKVTKLLEKYVEWIVLCLGVLFLLWMIYGNVIQRPVTVPVAGQEVSPGEIDQMVYDGPVKKLQGDMLSTTVPPMPVQDFLKDQQDKLSADPTALASLNRYWISTLVTGSTGVQTPTNEVPVVAQVVKLPEPAPAAINLQISSDRSNVLKPSPGAVPAGGGAANAGIPTDINWVSVSADIDVKKIAADFADKHIPAALSNVTMLRVILTREEQNAQGNWGNPTVVDPLTNVSLEDLPNQAAGIPVQSAYVQWAEKNQADLLQPPFYQVLQGAAWRTPGTAAPQPVVQEAPFDPATFSGNPSTLPPDQKQQYEDYQKQKEKEARDKRRAAAAAHQSSTTTPPYPGPGGPGGYGGGGGYPGPGATPTPPRRTPTFTPTPAPAPMPFRGPPGFQPGMTPYGGMPPYPMPGMNPADAGNGNPGTIPQGAFNPVTQTNFTVWAHDDSVQPGRTYRYKINYVIKNPVLGTFNVCNPQKLADQFTIVSADSAWSAPVTVQSETNFFVVQVAPNLNAPKATFEIYIWKNGAWQKQTFEAHAGDMIGGPEGTGATAVDFTTGWSLVDVRDDPHNPDGKIVILTSNNGKIIARDSAQDRASPEHQRLDGLVPPPAAPGNAAAMAP